MELEDARYFHFTLSPTTLCTTHPPLRWFTRAEVEAARARIDSNPMLRLGRPGGGGSRLEGSPPVFLAPRGAIAYHLVSSWLDSSH